MAARLPKLGVELATDPRHTQWLCPLLLLADLALCSLIIHKIACKRITPKGIQSRADVLRTDTEIDWKAYMEQIETYLAGERDYVKIRGGTGPLVYPAAHVYIYRGLYALTDAGTNIRAAQYIFGALYLLTLGIVMACYRKCKVPPYVYPMLVMSKRLHSIFVLRLFNDCFAAALLFLAIACYQRRLWTAGAIAFSLGLATKMTLLLSLPAVGVILLQALGPISALRKAGIIAQVQFLLAMPFLTANPRSYLSRAFELSRAFLFKWTVNWRFVGEDVFLSKTFAASLLVCHASLLTLFLSTRWLQPSRQTLAQATRSLMSWSQPKGHVQALTAARITPRYILVTMLSANAIGMLCARSLHYQFYALIAWTTPFLLWSAGVHPVLQYALWALQEVAWNVYPSTTASSLVVVGVLASTVGLVWLGAAEIS